MIKTIKELLKDDKQVQERILLKFKNDKELEKYINFKAGKYLKNINGAIKDDVVLGWAIHFYIESKETIDKEMRPAPRVIKKLTPEEQIIKDKKDKERRDKESKKRKDEIKARTKKMKELNIELLELKKTDPFRIHEIDDSKLVIISREPKKNNESQIGLFEL